MGLTIKYFEKLFKEKVIVKLKFNEGMEFSKCIKMEKKVKLYINSIIILKHPLLWH